MPITSYVTQLSSGSNGGIQWQLVRRKPPTTSRTQHVSKEILSRDGYEPRFNSPDATLARDRPTPAMRLINEPAFTRPPFSRHSPLVNAAAERNVDNGLKRVIQLLQFPSHGSRDLQVARAFGNEKTSN